jgi:hypothetical protein
VEIAYIDESYDDSVFTMSALLIPGHAWKDCFTAVRDYRRELKNRFGIFTTKELHATDFVAGRGRISPRTVSKGIRARIFHETLDLVTTLPGAAVISGAWEIAGTGHQAIHAKAFARIHDRLQRRCSADNSQMVRVVDQGREVELRKVARRSAVYNMVGSRYGVWEDGARAKNIPWDRMVEDPVFKDSAQSYFLQLADFIAFALLKSEVPPTPRIEKYRIYEAYDRLDPVCVKVASAYDHRKLGIVRS